MGHRWADPERLDYEERPRKEGETAARTSADLTSALELKQSRARLWRYPPHTTERRHRDEVQEEVFVVISGTLTMLLGDEPERVDLGPGGVVAVEPMTPLRRFETRRTRSSFSSSTAHRRSAIPAALTSCPTLSTPRALAARAVSAAPRPHPRP